MFESDRERVEQKCLPPYITSCAYLCFSPMLSLPGVFSAWGSLGMRMWHLIQADNHTFAKGSRGRGPGCSFKR
jgi:hypothetical protein